MIHISKRFYVINQLVNDINNHLIKDNHRLPHISGYINKITKLKTKIFIDLMDGTTNFPLKFVLNNNNEGISTNQLHVGQTLNFNNWIIKFTTPNRLHTFELQNDLKSSWNIPSCSSTRVVPNQKGISLTTLRSHPLTKFKNNYMANLLRFRSFITTTIINILTDQSHNFIKVEPPIITTNDTEGNNDTFKLLTPHGVFPLNQPNELNLTVSTQLHLEILAQSLSNVFALQPCFRAEASDTGRHLTEFWMLELESVQWDTLEKLVEFTQSFIINIIKHLINNKSTLLQGIPALPGDSIPFHMVETRWDWLANTANWNTIQYIDAIKELQNHSHHFNINPPTLQNINKQSIASEHEKWISTNLFKGGPVFIMNYPRSLKPFYMRRDHSDSSTVQCFDLIFPEVGEIIGGSIREDSLSILQNNVPRDLNWYAQLRSLGYRTSGGFGLGIERFIAYLIGVKNVKDTLPFYRSAKSKITL